MKVTSKIALIGVYIALLIGGQLALSGIVGVEIITALLVVFCFRFGIKDGLVIATAFSLIRCFIFGVFPSVVMLYLIYFNLLALVMGSVGLIFKNKLSILSVTIIVVVTAVLTACFTLLDDIITPLYYGFSQKATKAYFVASIPVIVAQVPISSISTAIFIYPLYKCFEWAKISY